MEPKNPDQQPGVARGSSDVVLDDLLLLLSLARTGRMVVTADALGVDHTTVRRRIRRLEKALGCVLIENTSNGWVLTSVGRDVTARAHSLEQVADNVRAAASGVGKAISGSVRITAPDGFGVRFVAPAISRVLSQHPGLSVDLVTSTRPLTPRASGFDMSINVGGPQQGWFASQMLTEYTLGLYAAPTYLENNPGIGSLSDLGDHRLVFYVDSMLTVSELDLASRFEQMEVALGCTNIFAQLQATSSGAGIGILPGFIAAMDPSLVRVLPYEVEFLRKYSITLRREEVVSPALEVIRAALIEEVTQRSDALVPYVCKNADR